MCADEARDRLIGRGAAALADALLLLAQDNEDARGVVERLQALPAENLQRAEAALAQLQRFARRGRGDEPAPLSAVMQTMLADLRAGDPPARLGCEMVAALLRVADAIVELCGDHDDDINMVCTLDAPAFFAECARTCPDKAWLADLVFDLFRDDRYVVRTRLIDRAHEYLSGAELGALADRCMAFLAEADRDYERHRRAKAVESLAIQLGDGALFETARLQVTAAPLAESCLDIAQAHLECGDTEAAAAWLAKIATDGSWTSWRKDKLLLRVCERIGDVQQCAEISWRLFRRDRNPKSLSTLLRFVGEDRRAEIIDEEARLILADPSLSIAAAEFLVEIGRRDEAERYVLEREQQLDGDSYTQLRPLAEALDDAAKPLSASVIYRKLLESVLSRSQSRAYGHGADYLAKLGRLSALVDDWGSRPHHGTWRSNLRAAHTRKRAFWAWCNAADRED